LRAPAKLRGRRQSACRRPRITSDANALDWPTEAVDALAVGWEVSEIDATRDGPWRFNRFPNVAFKKHDLGQLLLDAAVTEEAKSRGA
jgi:hypothetical protein